MEKDDKGSTLIRIGVSGESSFWYRPTRVVPDSKAVKRSLVQLAFHTSAAFDLLHPTVADPEDRARGTTEVLGAVPPVGLQGANPPPRNWSKCILCNGKSIFMNTKM